MLLTRRLWLCCVLIATSACLPDPEGAFEGFERRVDKKLKAEADAGPDMPGGDAGPCTPPTVEQLAGQYVFGVSPTFLPSETIRSSTTIEVIPGKTDEAKVIVQLLTANEPFKVTGETVESTLRLDGANFTIDRVQINISGDANGLLPGVEAISAWSSHGTICVTDDQPLAGFCGITDGEVIEPIPTDFTGSDFGARRKVADEFPEAVSSCEAWSEIQ